MSQPKRRWVDFLLVLALPAILSVFLVLGIVGWDEWLVNWPW